MKINTNNKVVSLDLIALNNYNPKISIEESVENSKQYHLVKKSLTEHGQVDPLLVRNIGTIKEPKYELVNGKHRYLAMIELQWKEAEIKDLGIINRTEAIKIALSTERPKIDLDKIEEAKLLKELQQANDDMSGLPYLENEIEEMIKMLEFDFDKMGEDEYEDPEPKEKQEVTCPECGHKFTL
jgi:ParB-like chromosome segregation protein Spo0J